VDDSLPAVDEAVLSRLRNAIASEEGDEEEQLSGVLRMLGAETCDKTQLPLFGKASSAQLPGEFETS
jgi:hypothetical protein